MLFSFSRETSDSLLSVPVSFQSPESLGLEPFQLKYSLNKPSTFCRNEIGVSPGSAGWRREQRALNTPPTNFQPILLFLAFLGFYKKSQLSSHFPAETYFSFICSAKAITTLPRGLLSSKDVLTFLIHCCLLSHCPFPCEFIPFLILLLSLFLF